MQRWVPFEWLPKLPANPATLSLNVSKLPGFWTGISLAREGFSFAAVTKERLPLRTSSVVILSISRALILWLCWLTSCTTCSRKC